MRRSFARLAGLCVLAIATATFAGAASAGGGNGGDHGNSGDRGSSGGSYGQHDSSSGSGRSEGDHDSFRSEGTSDEKSYGTSDSGDHTSGDASKSEVKSSDVKSDHKSFRKSDDSEHKSFKKSDESEHKSFKKSDESEHKSFKKSDESEHKSFKKSDDDHAVKAEVKTFQKADHKITICHKTGSGFVSITVDKHSLKHGHTAAKGDIIPMPAGGCPAAVDQAVVAGAACTSVKGHGHHKHKSVMCGVKAEQKTVELEAQKPLVAKCGETLVTVAGGILHKAGHDKYVLIHPSKHSAHYKGKHEDDVVLADKQMLVSNGESCGAVAGAQETSGCAPVTTTKEVTTQVVNGVWHKTGSEKHPYVLIHPSENSAHWSGKHDDDIPNVVTVTKTVLVTMTPESCTTTPATTTATTTTQSAVVAPAATETTTAAAAPTVQVEAATVSQTAPGALPATQGTPVSVATPQGGVAGAQATLNTPKQSNGGVLGTVGNVAGASLPFTGFPLWVAVLLAVALIAAGLTLRGRGRDARL
jgi:hypothetical protein